MTGADYAQYKSVVASLAATGMPAPQAVQIAVQAYQQRNSTHRAGQDTSPFAQGQKGPIRDVIPDAKRGQLWIWQRAAHRWVSYPMLPQGASMYGQGIQAYRTALISALGQGTGEAAAVPPATPAGAPSAINFDMSPYGGGSGSP